MEDDGIREATAQVFNNQDQFLGTAWLASEGIVITAAHVVADLKSREPLTQQFRLRFPNSWAVAVIVPDSIDYASDIAALKVDNNHTIQSFSKTIPLAYAKRVSSHGSPWRAFGYPLGDQRGIFLSGTVESVVGSSPGITSAIQLTLRTPQKDLHGISGAAVMVDGVAIGILVEERSGDEFIFYASPFAPIGEHPSFVPAETGLSRIVCELDQKQAAKREMGELSERFDEYCTVLAELLNKLPYIELVKDRSRTSIPPLSSIYVKLAIKRAMHNKFLCKGNSNDDTPITIEEAVSRGKHILLQGEPGSGKTSIVKSLAVRLAVSWCNGQRKELIPVYLSARELAKTNSSDGSLGGAIEKRIVSFLEKRLIRGLKPNFFVNPLPDRFKWLVIIDGIDEVVDPEERRALIDSISNQVRFPEQRIVFLLTSRPLVELETALTGEYFCRYDAIPFQDCQVKDLVKKWFQYFNRTEADADNFLTLLQKSRIRDLTRSPVFITMATLTFLWQPAAATLPDSRVDLYEKFLDVVLDEAGSPERRNALCEEWRKQFGDRGAEVCRGLIGNAKVLLVEVAMFQQDHGVESVETLSEACKIAMLKGWLNFSWPLRHNDIRWITEFGLGQVLVGTGLLVEFGGGLIFVHNTMREYLVALHITAHQSPLQENGSKVLERWVDPRWTQITGACLLKWGKREEFYAYLEQFLRSLTCLSMRGAKFAGELIADGFRCGRELELEVVERLLRWNPCADLFSTFTSPDPSTTLSLLSDREVVRNSLVSYFRKPSCPKALRAILMLVLRNLGVTELKEIAESAKTDWVRVNVAVGMGDLGCREGALPLLRAIALDKDCSVETRQRSLQGIVDMGDREFIKTIRRRTSLPGTLRGYAYLIGYQVSKNPVYLRKAVNLRCSGGNVPDEGDYTLTLLEVLASSGRADAVIALVSAEKFRFLSDLEHILKLNLSEVRPSLLSFLASLARDENMCAKERVKAIVLLLKYGQKDEIIGAAQKLFVESDLEEYEKVDLAIKLAHAGCKEPLKTVAQAETFEMHSKLNAIVALTKLDESDKWAQKITGLAACQDIPVSIKLLLADALIEIGLGNDAARVIEDIMHRNEPTQRLVRLLHNLYRADLIEAILIGGKATEEVAEMCVASLVNLGAFTNLARLKDNGQIIGDAILKHLPANVALPFTPSKG